MILASCGILGSDSDSSATEPIGGDPTPMGAVGNTYEIFALQGTNNRSVEVVSFDGGVSTIQASATITNPAILELANQSSSYEVNENKVTGTGKFRITTKGIQSYSKDGKPFTLVEYDAKVGDKYKLKRSGSDLVRTVTKVSKEDDFLWDFMYIKTIQIEETGLKTPGISKVVYYANHRFGIVGMDVYHEDGSKMLLGGSSENFNN